MTTPPATLVLDYEAVRALADVQHRNHRRALAFMEVANQRSTHRRGGPAVLVPVAVRVEAAWDRSAPLATLLNRISRARDVVDDAPTANRAAQIRRQTGVSVVDASVGQASEAALGPVAILTSDPTGMQRLASLVHNEVRVVRL